MKDLEKNHQYYEKNTRRFFQSNGEIVIADGKIVGYGSDEESNSRLYHNVHGDGDEEDLDENEAKVAVDAYAKKLKVPPPNYKFPDNADGQQSESDDDINDPWPDNLTNGQWDPKKRFYASLNDESFYKMAKKHGLNPTRLLKSHKDFYPAHLRLHPKLQAGTLIDMRLYDRYDEATTELAEERAQELDQSKNSKTKKKNEKKTRNSNIRRSSARTAKK